MAKLSDTIANYLQLNQKIQAKQFSPIYFFHGEEVFFIDSLVEQLENSVLDESERSFNQSIKYGKELKIHELIAMARRYPMMGQYQLIVVKDAQDMKDFDKLLPYLENPLVSTILVCAFRGAKMDMRTKIGKQLDKHVSYYAGKLRDYQIKDWLPEYLKQRGRSIDGAAIQMLVELLGADLPLIHNELNKLLINVKDEFIRISHVEANVGFNREYNVFELQSALGYKNFNKAIQIAHQMGFSAEKGELLRIVTNLYNYFGKILRVQQMVGSGKNEIAIALGVSPFFVEEYIVAANQYSVADIERAFNQIALLDLRLKGVHRGSATDGEILVDLIVGILRDPKGV
ncbi:MAG: DNA polymerase III subunit delta [Flavobacteriales bacterium]|nr:MAG: DNA polymerase III subunit delta [Flavobacteriales bacterium]